jgi:hypothetical protein
MHDVPKFIAIHWHSVWIVGGESSPDSSVSPLAVVVQAPIFSPAAATSNRRMNSVDERALSTCFDTPNWKDIFGNGCEVYEENDEPGCPIYGSLSDGGMGVANDNCCHCLKDVSQMQYIMQAIVSTFSNDCILFSLSSVLTLPIGMMVSMAVLGMKKMTVKVVPSTANCLVKKLWVSQKIIVATARDL